jgi:hypothetical protein
MEDEEEGYIDIIDKGEVISVNIPSREPPKIG